MNKLQITLTSVAILIAGFVLLFWADWRIGLGAGLVYWAELIQNNLDDTDPPSTHYSEPVIDNEELDPDYKYRTKA